MMRYKTILVSALALGVSAVFAAPEVNYVSPQNSDFTSPALKLAGAKFAEVDVATERETVSFSWAVNPNQAISATQQTYRAQSQQYWLDVSTAKLAGGVSLHTTSTQALIRLSPIGESQAKSSLNRSQLVIEQAGRQLSGSAAVETFAAESELKAAGVDFGAGTIAFRLKQDINPGEFTLRIDGLSKNSQSSGYIVHVFEPNSVSSLNLKSATQRYQLGQQVDLDLSLDHWQGKVSVDDFQGYLSSQNGKDVLPLSFSLNNKGGWTATAQTRQMSFAQAGLWEANIFLDTQDGAKRLLRDAKTAVSITAASARLDGGFSVSQVEHLSDGIQMNLSVEAAAAGRYEVRGVLYGTDYKNQLVPIAVSNTAAWLEQGKGSLALSFDQELLSKAQAFAPYEIRHLTLNDQGRLQTLWHQHRAFTLSNK